MPFPFIPAGLVLAAAVLGGAYAIFAVGLRLLDRAALSVRNSIAPGVVSGLRTWSHAEARPRPPESPGMAAFDLAAVGPHRSSDGRVEDLTERPDIVTQHVHRGGRHP